MTAPSFGWSRHLISNSGADAEQQLVAAIIASARESCAAGSRDDCEWLAACGVAYLSLIVPDGVDERDVLDRLLADLPDPELTEGWRKNAENFTQMVLGIALEQEVTHGHGGDLPEMRTRTPTLPRGDPLRYVEAATLPGV